jgi:O-antigen ligase
MNYFILTFLIVLIVSSVFAYFPEISYKNLSKYYLWVLIYFLIVNIVNTRKRLFLFVLIFLVASFKLSASLAITWAQRGFSFTSWGLMGPPGFFQNSGELTIQMLVYWPIALATASFIKPHLNKWVYWVLLAMPITAWAVVVGASSRGGQIALVAQLLKKYSKNIFRPKTLIAACIIAWSLWSFLPEEQKKRFSVSGEDKTSEQRLLYWENGWEMMVDHPALGVGFYNFVPYYEIYYPDDVLYSSAQLPHNIFIQVGTDSGFIGLAIYLSIVVFAFWSMRSLSKAKSSSVTMEASLAKGFNYSLIGFIVAGQFVSVAYYPFLWIHAAFIVALRNIALKRGYRKNRE